MATETIGFRPVATETIGFRPVATETIGFRPVATETTGFRPVAARPRSETFPGVCTAYAEQTSAWRSRIRESPSGFNWGAFAYLGDAHPYPFRRS
ncbi:MULTISPECIES: hypothetical protein [Streptomyces]